jgi:mRNA interferase MazF
MNKIRGMLIYHIWGYAVRLKKNERRYILVCIDFFPIGNNESEVNIMQVWRGEIFYADLSPVIGSEQGGVRPVLIIQNDVGNKYSPTVICAAITSQINKAKLPTHIEIDSAMSTLVKDSVILLEQIRTIDKKRLREKICRLDDSLMRRVNRAIMVSLGLDT